MFAKVLVPTDFSLYADAVIRCIQAIPGIREVVLLHIATPPASAPAYRPGSAPVNPRALLANAEMVLRDTGLDVSSIVLTTGAEAVADSVVRVAEEEQVDLILIGARGKGIIRSILIGSVSSAVLHRAKTNVLIMRHRILETLQGITYEKFCPRIYAKVLIPTDFSDSSRRFLAHLDNLPGLGRVILAHIVTHGEEPEIVHAFVEDAELALTGLKNDLSPHKFGITTAIRIGNPAHEIDRLAEEEDVSLILVTSSGKGRLQEFFLGSTAFAITELAKRPVLVVKRLPAPAGER